MEGNKGDDGEEEEAPRHDSCRGAMAAVAGARGERATDLSSELLQVRLQHGYTHSHHQHRLGAR